MEDIFVARLMTTDLQTVPPDTLVEDAAGVMLAEDVGSVLVVDDDDRIEGILTSTDFVRIVKERKPKDQTPVSAYMSTDVVTADPQHSISDVADLILDQGFHHLPVVDDEGRAIGIVTTTDITAYVSHLEAPQPN